VTISTRQGVKALLGLLQSPLAGSISNLTNGIINGLGLGGVLGSVVVPVPLNLPNGRVGGSTQQTKVCS
jgi:hypothetical protein